MTAYSDDELNARITEQLTFTDFSWALTQGFKPTSKTMPPSSNWGGKYKCIYCTCTGYFWGYSGPKSKIWWGYTHGNNCRKAP